jgi:hypothetical protein
VALRQDRRTLPNGKSLRDLARIRGGKALLRA